MAHEVFISYATEDKAYGDAVCATLEARGIRCWIAPRDVLAGTDYGRAILGAINGSRLMVLILSSSSNASPHVRREIERAASRDLPILPLRVEDVAPSESLELFLAGQQWLDAFGPLTEANLDTLAEAAGRLLSPGPDPPRPPRPEQPGPSGGGSLSSEIDLALNHQALARALPSLDPGDCDRLDHLSDLTVRHFLGTPGGDYWAVHGLRHTNGILRLLESILPEEVKGRRDSCFALAAAACLHDWGRLSREPLSDVSGGPKDGLDVIRWLPRDTHHVRSMQNVQALAEDLRLDSDQAGAIAALSYYHNARTNPQELLGQPETAKLSALFRVANACDMGALRAPVAYCGAHRDQIWGKGLLRELRCPAVAEMGGRDGAAREASLSAAIFWFQNLMVKNISVRQDEREIVIACRVPYGLDFIPRQIGVNLDRVLVGLLPLIGEWHTRFEEGGLPECDTTLGLEEAVLLGARMYADPQAVLRSSSDLTDYFVRSVVALAAGGRDGEEAGRALETLKILAETLVRERPELHLMHSLQARFEALLDPEDPDSSLGAIGAGFRDLVDSRRLYPVTVGPEPGGALPGRATFGRIAQAALATLREEREGGAQPSPAAPFLNCLVFGQSGPVSAFLEFCALSGNRIRVLTPVMRPVGDGPVSQAWEKLRGMDGVAVEIIPDAAIPHVLDHGCDLALMGCEALLDDGSVANSLGARVFAEAVAASQVPLWVLTESAKACPASKRPQSPWYSATALGTLPVWAFMHEPAASAAARKLSTTYPRSELVPAALIDLIITEIGARSPGSGAD